MSEKVNGGAWGVPSLFVKKLGGSSMIKVLDFLIDDMF